MPRTWAPEVTEQLVAWSRGDPVARDRVVGSLYPELCRLASRRLANERSDHTLETSALVHEAYLRLSRHSPPACRDRSHFLAIAAITMRRVLIDHARRRGEPKRGGGAVRIPLRDSDRAVPGADPEVLALDRALERLAERSAEAARVVELRCFGGLTVEEIATAVGVSGPTVRRRWRMARAWLHAQLATAGAGGAEGHRGDVG